jgi:hypothetical protein
MRLSEIAREHRSARRVYVAVVGAERSAWRDSKFRRVAERHLDPLLSEVDRFERDLLETDRRLERARRLLDQRV